VAGQRAQHHPVGLGLGQVEPLAAARPVNAVRNAPARAERAAERERRRAHRPHRAARERASTPALVAERERRALALDPPFQPRALTKGLGAGVLATGAVPLLEAGRNAVMLSHPQRELKRGPRARDPGTAAPPRP